VNTMFHSFTLKLLAAIILLALLISFPASQAQAGNFSISIGFGVPLYYHYDHGDYHDHHGISVGYYRYYNHHHAYSYKHHRHHGYHHKKYYRQPYHGRQAYHRGHDRGHHGYNHYRH